MRTAKVSGGVQAEFLNLEPQEHKLQFTVTPSSTICVFDCIYLQQLTFVGHKVRAVRIRVLFHF
jgi:hypothetical protein